MLPQGDSLVRIKGDEKATRKFFTFSQPTVCICEALLKPTIWQLL